MIVTDKVQIENGADFSFVCKKIPFAITCSSEFVNKGCNLIDLDLVNKMQLRLRNIKVCRTNILGQNMRAVGYIKQSIQCVQAGKVIGTVHLTAKVIRDLYSVFNMDCVASANTYTRLTGHDPPPADDHLDDELEPPLNIPMLGGDDDIDPRDDDGNLRDDDGDLRDDDDDPGDEKIAIDGSSVKSRNDDDESNDEVVLAYLQNPSANPVYQTSDPDSYDYTEDPNFEFHNDPNQLPDGVVLSECVKHEWVNCKLCNVDPNSHTMTQPQHSSEDDSMCDLCYKENLPAEIFLSHPTLHPRCPSISDLDKRRMYGNKWRTML